MPVASIATLVTPHSFNHSTRSSCCVLKTPNERTGGCPCFTDLAGTQTKFSADPTSMPPACKLICSRLSSTAAVCSLALRRFLARPSVLTGKKDVALRGECFVLVVFIQNVVVVGLVSDVPVRPPGENRMHSSKRDRLRTLLRPRRHQGLHR